MYVQSINKKKTPVFPTFLDERKSPALKGGRLPVFKEFHHDLAAVSTKDDESDSDFESKYLTHPSFFKLIA